MAIAGRTFRSCFPFQLVNCKFRIKSCSCRFRTSDSCPSPPGSHDRKLESGWEQRQEDGNEGKAGKTSKTGAETSFIPNNLVSGFQDSRNPGFQDSKPAKLSRGALDLSFQGH